MCTVLLTKRLASPHALCAGLRLCGALTLQRSLNIQCNTYCNTHCDTHCNTHYITHCNTHCNTHCITHCNTHCNTHCKAHCNTSTRTTLIIASAACALATPRGWRLKGQERKKKNIWTARQVNHDSLGRFCCYRCSTLFNSVQLEELSFCRGIL